MVPEQSSLRRHSTGNAAVSAAALKSLRDAAAAAEDVKNKLSEQRRPSYGRLPLQQQLNQQVIFKFKKLDNPSLPKVKKSERS
jgi:hypothetical protein